MLKKLFLTILGIIIVYASVAFAIKSGLGVLPVDAAITSISDVIGMKIGTFTMLFHGCFFIGQIIIEKKNFQKIQILQLLYITLGGSVLNFFLYVVLAGMPPITFYPLRLLITISAQIAIAFGCTLVLETRLIRTPMEGCIQLIADRIGMTMGRLRQIIDVVLVLISVTLTLLCHTDWALREGTIIAAILFGPAMDFWKKRCFSQKEQLQEQ
ncbi:MAG: hypothetical protein E7487_01655 [Ruminococcaceae bacterium]|nr:hypothetical protein [Oscillospiraceae bacterium]